MLRKYGVDELPQLFNILKGDMSFIGPRPYPLKYYDYFTEEQKKRLAVLPGMLGPSTCQYIDLSILEKNELDCSYVDNFSFRQDLDIIKMSVCNFNKILSSREKCAAGNKDTMKNDFLCLKRNLQYEEVFNIESKKNQLIQSDDISSVYDNKDLLFEEVFVCDTILSSESSLQKKIGTRRYNK